MKSARSFCIVYIVLYANVVIMSAKVRRLIIPAAVNKSISSIYFDQLQPSDFFLMSRRVFYVIALCRYGPRSCILFLQFSFIGCIFLHRFYAGL